MPTAAYPFENTRATLRRSLVGTDGFTWVREPRSALAVTLWPYSQVLHAYALADPVSGPARFPGLARGLRGYRDPRGAYRESLGRGKRYFDDNAWIGLAFLQRYIFTGDEFWRGRARDVDEFLRTGYDPGTGGILWVEGGDTVNACSTGAAALLHAELGHPIDAELEFLSWLRDGNGLVRDHVRADGHVEPSVWSYNQGLFLAAAMRAGRNDLAAEVAEAAEAHFTAERLWDQAVCFNAVYAKACLRWGRAQQVVEYARRLADEGRDPGGWYSLAGRYDSGKVLDTAGALQIFTVLDFPHLADRVV